MVTASRALTGVLGLALLAADYAALDDITTGNQPHFYWEWLFLVASLPLLAFLLRKWRRRSSWGPPLG